ncbi:MAG: hypothetical protein CO150_05645 [Nitrospirae bacterium CG_4_9_14_3_um_filter_53_35]|nr:MAG: hypothetical protein AUK29_06380 [Nitrospirae bacterium CG2_30_53_67]PIS36480.1 MAG: hypothetical protein COT35_11015 [Nitrospirae bacterium CG08_land_8_20_14_0_20_52_24]PIV82711.1 MAG: hypothetical protein COW52_12160 [Nitrospirae bacterium CG17_big_fil_post_rev_8_21_14_2_50_50_9]PIW84442.1 MAG: hypothetical protein COZ95_09820 [Nitrospirae bacterium CG_4_8_14_3_um_filter_50_41]PIX84668.1 MAG: hypothetical protein COZ32_12405 [Nitrospirae bacterium CG_4_10_14_3_um_filter_53_41]PJA7502
MNLLDITIIVIVGSAFVLSLFKGVIREVFSLGSVILGFLIANHTFEYMGEFMLRFIHHPPLSKILGYALVFVGSTLAIRLIGVLLEGVTRQVMLGWADHLLGAVFGFLKGCLIVSVIIMLMTSFMPGSRVLQESKLTPYIISTVGLIAKAAPQEIQRRFEATREKLDQIWKERKISSMIRKEKDVVMDKLMEKEKK